MMVSCMSVEKIDKIIKETIRGIEVFTEVIMKCVEDVERVPTELKLVKLVKCEKYVERMKQSIDNAIETVERMFEQR